MSKIADYTRLSRNARSGFDFMQRLGHNLMIVFKEEINSAF